MAGARCWASGRRRRDAASRAAPAHAYDHDPRALAATCTETAKGDNDHDLFHDRQLSALHHLLGRRREAVLDPFDLLGQAKGVVVSHKAQSHAAVVGSRQTKPFLLDRQAKTL